MLEGLLAVYYEAGHEKMTKSEIWTYMGDWDQVTNFINFRPKSSQMTQTQKRTLLEAEKPCVTNAKYPKFGKIRKNHFLFSLLVVFWPKTVEKRHFLVVGRLRKV